MSQLWATGPVAIWTSNSYEQTGTPIFLGWGERAPDIQTRPYWREIICDVGGEAPIDRLLAGETATVSFELVRHNALNLLRLQSRGANASVTSPRGTMKPGSIGSLAILETGSVKLWLNFPYAAKPAMGSGALLEPGYHFFAATLDPDTITVGSTTPKKVRMTFFCQPVLEIIPGGSYGGAQMTLYDHDMSAITGLSVD